MSINDGYNSKENLNLLLNSFAEQIYSFAETGIFFKAWYVNVFRKDHEAMYRRLGFKYLLDNKSFGKLYYLDCIPSGKKQQEGRSSTNPIISMNKRLMELYHEHFLQSP
jgi:hypothetical protein